MFCLYNGEYGEHDLSYIGGIEAIVKKQNNSYIKYAGQIVGDYTIVRVDYDWGIRTQVAEIKCNYCGKTKSLQTDVSAWRRGKGCSRRCECYAIRKNIDKILEPIKPKPIPLNDPSWVGQESNGWRILSYDGNSEFFVECIDCGRTKKARAYQFKNKSIPKCNHAKINDYTSSEWIGKRVGNLTVIDHIQKHLLVRCDCGREIEVRGTDLFRKKTITTCKDPACPYYEEQRSKTLVAERRKKGLDYEHKARELFISKGLSVETTPDVGDYGVDFIVNLSENEKLAIQCKRYNSPVPVRAVQEVYAGGRYYDCNRFAIISPSGYAD